MSNNEKFLSSIYPDKTISLIIEEAINGVFQLMIIDLYTGTNRILNRQELAAIYGRSGQISTEIELEPPSSTFIPPGFGFPSRKKIQGFGRRQNVRYADLRASDSEVKKIIDKFGCENEGITIGHLTFSITPLSPAQKKDRMCEIQNYPSLERRAAFIKKRGNAIYEELWKKYPNVIFKKEEVASFLLQEESPLYASLEMAVPVLKSYVKHTRKLKKNQNVL